MWILPKNYEPFPSAQDMVASNLELNLRADSLSRCVTVNAKPMSSQTCLKKLKTVPWLLHLSTRMLNPFLHGAFMVKLICSRAATPANLSQQQDGSEEKMIRDTSGRTSSNTSKTCDQNKCSSKTSTDTSTKDLNKSSVTWEQQVIEQRGEYSARMKLATLMNESASLSWATPNTMDHLGQRSDEAVIRQATTTRKGRKRPSNLREQVNRRTCAIYDAINGDGSMDNLPPASSEFLNPLFLEQLMGVRIGLTGLGCWGMESSHEWQGGHG